MKICPACRFDRCDDTATRCRQCGADLTEEDEDEGGHANLAAAWFHYLEVPRIGTLELVPGQAFSMGREPRNNLVLPRAPDAELLRIWWSDDYDEATVQLGQGASATLKVDGVRIASTAKRVLRGGEEIEIGVLRLRYLKRGKKVDKAIALSTLKGHGRGSRRGAAPQQRVAGGGARKPGDLRKAQALDPSQRTFKPAAPAPKKRRRAATVRPADLVKAIEKTSAYGTLRVQTPRERGWITVMAGKPKHAAFGDRKGRDALIAVLRLGPCRCHLDPGLPKRGSGPELTVGFSDVLRALAGKGRPPQRGTAPPPKHPPSAGRRTKRGPFRP